MNNAAVATQQEFADEQLNVSLNSAEVQRAVKFLESFGSSTHALRALVAAMCSEHEAFDCAAVLESVIEKFAAVEAESV